MKGKLKIHQYTFAPAAYDTTETRAVMGVKRGTWIRGVFVRVGVAFNGTTPTVSIGDGAGAEIFATAAQVACAATGLKAGYGTAFSGANGKMYTEDDTVDLFYTYNTGTTTGECTVFIVYQEVE